MPNYCPECGEELDKGDKYCPECGNNLSKGSHPDNSEQHGSDQDLFNPDRPAREIEIPISPSFIGLAAVVLIGLVMFGPQLFFLMTTAAGGNNIQSLDVEQVEIREVNVGTSGFSGILDITLRNPNPVPAEVGLIKYNISLNGNKVAEGSTTESATIGGNSEGSISTQLYVSEINAAASGLELLWNDFTGTDSTYEIDGAVTVDLGVRDIEVPFSESGTL